MIFDITWYVLEIKRWQFTKSRIIEMYLALSKTLVKKLYQETS